MYDFLFVIIELLSLALTVEMLQAEICRCERFLKGGVSLWLAIKGGSGCRPPTTVGPSVLGGRKLEELPFMWYKNIAGWFFALVTKHACDRRMDRRMDGRTDRQNYDSQDRASIAESRGKNYFYNCCQCQSCDLITILAANATTAN